MVYAKAMYQYIILTSIGLMILVSVMFDKAR